MVLCDDLVVCLATGVDLDPTYRPLGRFLRCRHAELSGLDLRGYHDARLCRVMGLGLGLGWGITTLV